MASAFLSHTTDVTVSGGSIVLTFLCSFYGTDVPNGADQSLVIVTITPSDTATQIRNKFATAVGNEATRLGLSVPATAMILPSYTRG